jgi:CubicO group peptidase (beta-lactamase class C family)
MTSNALPTSTPSGQGVDADGIRAFVDALEASPTQDPHSLMLLRHGHVIAQGWWAPYVPERRHLLYSLSKSFTSAAAGLALGDGLIRLDDPVISYFPEFEADITDARSRRMLVRHVASMSTGHTYDTLDKAVALDPTNPVRGLLLLPPDEEPGTVFAYNQPATYTLAAIVQKLTGGTLIDFLRPRLLDPLGIAPVGWQQFPPGRNLGFSGLFANTEAIAKLGQLTLQRGQWQGTQLLPAEWVDEATVAHISTAGEAPESPDWQQGYGFQFWMARHGFRGDGAFGQFMVILPEQDAVLAITSQTDNMQETLDLAWEHLLPAFGTESRGTDAPPSDAAASDSDLRLAVQLADRRLPLPAVTVGTAWPTGTFVPTERSRQQQKSLASVELRRDTDRTVIELVDAGGTLVAAVGDGAWEVTESGPVPMAVAGGTDASGTAHVEVAFIETPHRLRITFDAAASTFDASWVTQPLRVDNTPLTDLATPAPIG